MSVGQPVAQGVLERAAALMNAIGVFEGLRVLAEEGVGAAHPGPLRVGEHFWVVPYTEHLSRKRAKVGPPPERGPAHPLGQVGYGHALGDRLACQVHVHAVLEARHDL